MDRQKTTVLWILSLFFCIVAGGMEASAQPSSGKRRKAEIPKPLPTVQIRKTEKSSSSPVPTAYGERDRKRDSLFLDATTLYLIDKPGESLQAYLSLLEKDPQNATAAFQAGNLLAGQNRFSDALVYAEQACRLQPENEWFQLLRGQLYKTSRQFKKAADVFATLQQLRPDNLNYAYERANMFVMAGDLPASIAVYNELQDRLGHTDAWSMQKYKMYLSTGDTKAAKKEIEEISAAIPGQAKYLEMLAQMSMKEKDYKQAYRYLKKILEIKPDDPYIHISLADYYRNTGDFGQAYRSLEKAVSNPQLDFKTKLSVLQAYYTGRDNLKPKGDVIAQAKRLFFLLNQNHPNEPEGFFTHGKFLILLGEVPDAVSLLERAIELDSNVYGSWELLLFAANQLADTALLKATGEKATERFPEQAGPHMYLAISYLLQGDLEKAVASASACRKRNLSGNPYMEKVSLQILGDGYFELREYEKSLQAYEELFRLDPDDKYIRNNYAYYLALTGSKLSLAETLAEDLCREEPENATFLDTYAWTLYRSGKYEKARVIIEKALKYGAEKDATVLEHYGDILYKLGESAKAMDYWKKAIQTAADPELQDSLRQKMANPAAWKEDAR